MHYGLSGKITKSDISLTWGGELIWIGTFFHFHKDCVEATWVTSEMQASLSPIEEKTI